MKVAVLMGGTTSEREISLRTGRGMAQALRRLGHQTVSVDAADGRLLPAGDEERAGASTDALATASPTSLVSAAALREAEVVLIALHGGAGENGTLQALLELAGKPYTGSGVLASALANSSELETQPNRVWITSRDASWLLRGRSCPTGSCSPIATWCMGRSVCTPRLPTARAPTPT